MKVIGDVGRKQIIRASYCDWCGKSSNDVHMFGTGLSDAMVCDGCLGKLVGQAVKTVGGGDDVSKIGINLEALARKWGFWTKARGKTVELLADMAFTFGFQLQLPVAEKKKEDRKGEE